MAIRINTAAVSATADQIDALNMEIRNSLSDIDSSIRDLRQCWEGKSLDTAVNKFEYIKRNCFDARFVVINNVVLLMRNQVGEGYDVTEQTISTAASTFK